MKFTRILRAAALALLIPFAATHAGEVRQISQILDSGGKPVVNGYIYVGTYGADPVTNPLTIYSDPGLTTPITNPQRTDSYGRPVNDIYFLESQYSYTLKDSNSVVIEGPRNRYSVATTQAGTQSGSTTWAGTAGGSANAITLNLTPTLTTYSDGMIVRFRIASANTGAITVNIDGNGAKSLVKPGALALVANDLLAGDVAVIVYDSANNRFNVISDGPAVLTSGTQTVAGNKTFTGASTFSAALGMNGAALNLAQGADVASAATLNLDAMTGNEGQLTGAVTVTAVTLTNGRTRRLRATGAVPITASASLVVNLVPSGSTYTCAVGDVLHFEAIQGVVYIWVLKMAPGVGSGMQLLSTTTANNQATVDIFGMTGFTHYMVTLDNVVPATNGTQLQMRASTDGSTFLSTGIYGYAGQQGDDGGATAGWGSSGAAATSILLNDAADISNVAANGGLSGSVLLRAAGNAVARKFGTSEYMAAASATVTFHSGKDGFSIGTSSAVVGLRFLMNSGNISSGTFKLYGIP